MAVLARFTIFTLSIVASVSVMASSIAWGQGQIDSISGRESLAPPVAELLHDEQVLHNKNLWPAGSFDSDIDPRFAPEKRPKFPLPYYLIPADEGRFLTAATLNPGVHAQITQSIDDRAYVKLFVHPESEAYYAELKNRYRYVGPQQTEFTASPTSSYRSLLVWQEGRPSSTPFIAKVTLARTVMFSISRIVKPGEIERSLATQAALEQVGRTQLRDLGFDSFPETAGFIPLQENGTPIGGQIIREIPIEVLTGQVRWIAFTALMSPEGGDKPLIMKVIQASGQSGPGLLRDTFARRYFDMLDAVSLKLGINFEPHAQNMLLEVDAKFRPTGRFVLRDFGGFWPNILTMIRNGGPWQAYMGPANAETYYFLGGHTNALGAYAKFFQDQVFDMLVNEVAKYDAETKRAQAKLSVEARSKASQLFAKRFYLPSGTTITSDNYKSLAKQIKRTTPIRTALNPDQLARSKRAALNQTFDAFIQSKRAAGEWVELRDFKTDPASLMEVVVSDQTFFLVEGDIIHGFGLMTKPETESIASQFKTRRFKSRLCLQRLMPVTDL